MSINNHVQIIGNLGADPKISTSKNGKNVVNFTVATNAYWKDAEGQPQKRVDWHDVEAWDGLANIAALLLRGTQVLIMGNYRTDIWKDGKGMYHSRSKIVAERIRILSPVVEAEEEGVEAMDAELGMF